MGKKNSNRNAFCPPVRTPFQDSKLLSAVMGKIAKGEMVELLKGTLLMSEKTYSDKIDGASNDSFNLALCGAFIGAKNWGMSNDEIKDLAEATFAVFDDMGEDLARIQEAVDIVNGFGIDVIGLSTEDSEKNRKIMAHKTAVFYLLEHGTTEIEDILTQCKLHNVDIDYRDACAYRWEFNKKKYYQSMEDGLMSRKEEAFKLIEAGKTTEEIMDEMDISKSCVNYYRSIYKKENEGEVCMAKTKEKAIEMIKNGADVADLVKDLGISKTAAVKFIDKYNEEKNGGEIEIMTDNMKQAFALFDKAYSEAKVMEALDLGKATVHNYYSEWIRINKSELNTDEMSDILSGTDEGIVILRHKGVLKGESGENGTKKKAKKHFEANKAGESNETADQENECSKEEKGEEPVDMQSEHEAEKSLVEKPEKKGMTLNPEFEQAVKEMEEQDNKVIYDDKGVNIQVHPEPVLDDKYEYREMSCGLKKKVKVVEITSAIEGQFATYTPSEDGTFDIEIDGQVITINRDSMKTLGQELLIVSDTEI